MPKVGFGYDFHRLVEGRPLILAGVKLDHPMGLLGHSDADVLIHAVCDALLGAIASGDIGQHFPDTDPRYKDADSRQLLAHVMQLVREKGYRVENIDSTVIADEPKLASHIDSMRANLASDLDISIDQVAVKATTKEGLGSAGIEAHSVVLLGEAT